MNDSANREEQLNKIIAGYLTAVEAGQVPDHRELLRQYPQLAEELTAYFRDQDNFDRFAAGLPSPASADPSSETCMFADAESSAEATGRSPADKTLGTVRYFGDYELLEEIARGGMGVVYRARQVTLNRVVALKMILAGQLASAVEVQRFQAEAEAAANLDHPNIVPIYEVGEHEGQHYFSMKLIHQGSGVRSQGSDQRQAARFLTTVARTVHYAHQRGIIHRDLKPANILVDQQGQPHITDFGLAKRTEGDANLSQSGAIVGTPAYMAPEQAAGKKGLTTAVDVYSLGAILYELLTGKPPFIGRAPFDIIAQVLEKDPTPPRQIQRGIDRDLETICLKCLEKDPQKRYSTAEALAEDLERFQAGVPILARPVGSLERALKWVQRRPVVAGLAAAVVFLLVAGTAVSLYFAVAADQRADQAEKAEDRANRNARAAEVRTAEGLVFAADALLGAQRFSEARQVYAEAWEKARALGLGEIAPITGLLASYAGSAPPLLGMDGKHGGIPAFVGHAGAIRALAIAPDGRTALSASQDKTLKLWDVATGLEIYAFTGHKAAVDAVAFAPDGLTALSGSSDKTLKLWEVATGKEIRTFTGNADAITAVAFGPQGKTAASTSGWNGIVERLSDVPVAEIKLWEVSTGKALRAFPGRQHIFCMAMSPDGKTVLTGGWEWPLDLWDLETGKPIRRFVGHRNPVQCVALSSDGQQALTGSWDKTIKLWNVATGQAVRNLAGHDGRVNCVAFSPDGRLGLSGGRDKTVRLWRLDAGKLVATLTGHTEEVTSVRFLPGGRLALSASAADRSMKLWRLPLDDGSAGQEVVAFRGHNRGVTSVAVTSDGLIAASSGYDQFIKLWDVATGLEIRTLPGHGSQVDALSFSPDARTLLSGGYDEFLKHWDVATGQELRSIPKTGGSTHAFFMPNASHKNASHAISSNGDKSIRLWDLANGKEIRTLTRHQDFATYVDLSGDGQKGISSSLDGVVKFWDFATGEDLWTGRSGHGGVFCVAIAPDGRTALEGAFDGNLTLWDLETGKPVRTFSGHTDPVETVLFMPDGRHALSAGWDGSLKLWDVGTAKEIRTFPPHANRVRRLAISKDGRFIVIGSWDLAVKVWDFQRPLRYREFESLVPKAQQKLAKNPEDAQALAVFGRWYAFRGVDELAVDFLEKARKSPTEQGQAAVSSLTLARSYWRLNKLPEAEREFRQALANREASQDYLNLCLDAVCRARARKSPTEPKK